MIRFLMFSWSAKWENWILMGYTPFQDNVPLMEKPGGSILIAK